MKTKQTSLKQLIKKGKFDYTNPSIIEENFPPEPIRGELKLFHFDREITSEKAIEEMKKAGYQPANLYELLTFDWNGQDFVVALGSVWRHPRGDRLVPSLDEWCGECELSLLLFDGGWFDYCRFLAVRASGNLEPLEKTSGTLTLEARVKTLEEQNQKIIKWINQMAPPEL